MHCSSLFGDFFVVQKVRSGCRALSVALRTFLLSTFSPRVLSFVGPYRRRGLDCMPPAFLCIMIVAAQSDEAVGSIAEQMLETLFESET